MKYFSLFLFSFCLLATLTLQKEIIKCSKGDDSPCEPDGACCAKESWRSAGSNKENYECMLESNFSKLTQTAAVLGLTDYSIVCANALYLGVAVSGLIIQGMMW